MKTIVIDIAGTNIKIWNAEGNQTAIGHAARPQRLDDSCVSSCQLHLRFFHHSQRTSTVM
jgi:hypothetical protein